MTDDAPLTRYTFTISGYCRDAMRIRAFTEELAVLLNAQTIDLRFDIEWWRR